MKLRHLTAICTTLLITGSTATLVRAEPPTDKPDKREGKDKERPRGGMMLDRLRESLDEVGLSDEQSTKIDAIFAEARGRLESLRGELKDMDGPERREKMMEVMGEYRDQVAEVLNEDQRQQMKQKMDAARERLGDRGPGGERRGAEGEGPGPGGDRPGPDRVAKMGERLQKSLDSLDLTEEQKTKAQTIVQELKTTLAAIQEKAKTADTNARKEVKQALEASREKMKEVLTPEQQETLHEAMRPKRPAGDDEGDRDRDGDKGHGGKHKDKKEGKDKPDMPEDGKF